MQAICTNSLVSVIEGDQKRRGLYKHLYKQKYTLWRSSKRLLLVLALTFGTVLTGITASSAGQQDRPPEINSEPVVDHVRIYLDNSISMKGYVEGAGAYGDATYQDLILTLPTILEQPDTPVAYQVFGKQVQSIDRPSFLRAGQANFYTSKDSNIGEAFDAAAKSTEGELTLVITDLFLSGGGIGATSPLRRPLASSLRSGRTVAILGIYNPFKGKIWDVPNCPEGIEFDGQRPFYIVMVGHEANVDKLYQKLKRDLLDRLRPDSHRFVSFSHHLVAPVQTLGRDRVEVITPLPIGVVERGNVVKHATDIRQFRINREDVRNNSQPLLAIKLPLASAHPARPGYDTIEVREHLYRHRPDGSNAWEAANLSSRVVGEPKKSDSDALLNVFEKPQVIRSFPESAVFKLDLEILATKPSYTNVLWLKEWSFDAKDALSWCGKNKKAPPNPFKTLNLGSLSELLTSVLAEEYQPEVVARTSLVFRID